MFKEIHKSSRRRHEQVTTPLELLELPARLRTTVADHRSDTSKIAELLRFVKDLRHELARRRQDQSVRLGPRSSRTTTVVLGDLRRAVPTQRDEHRENKPARLARPRLRAGHHVSSSETHGQGVLLDRRRLRVVAPLQVLRQRVTENLRREALDGLGAVLARHLDGDLVVVVEVDAAAALRLVLGREQVLLQSLVRAHVAVKSQLVLAAAAAAAAEVPAAAAPEVAAAAAVAAAASVSSAAAAVVASPARVAAGPARVLLELRRLAALLVALEEGAAAAAASTSLGRSIV